MSVRRNSTISRKLRRELHAAQGGKDHHGDVHFVCYYCAKVRPASDATLEHIVPLQYGGTNDRPNLALACGECNSRRNMFVTRMLAYAARPLSFPIEFTRDPKQLFAWASRGIAPHALKGIVLVDGEWHFVNPLSTANVKLSATLEERVAAKRSSPPICKQKGT